MEELGIDSTFLMRRHYLRICLSARPMFSNHSELNKAHMHGRVPGHACHYRKGHRSPHTHTNTRRTRRKRGWYGDHCLICLFISLCLPLSRGGVCLKNVPRLGGWICMMNLEFIYLFFHPCHVFYLFFTFLKLIFITLRAEMQILCQLKGSVVDNHCAP